jgi:hypothetical protein
MAKKRKAGSRMGKSSKSYGGGRKGSSKRSRY